MAEYVFNIEPRVYLKRPNRLKWSEPGKVYHRYLEDIRKIALVIGFPGLPDEGASVFFYISMPKSWSKKKRRETCLQPHQYKKYKDLSNLLKALEDALRPGDDGYIWQYNSLGKFWVDEGFVVIQLPD